MKILVCIKPDMEGREMGPFEHLALEAGLQLRDACPGDARLDVAAAGPASFEECIFRALGMGADRGIHLLVPGGSEDTPGLVPAALTATRLAEGACAGASYDLILTGVMSQDLMAGQTGPMLAETLGVPCVTGAKQLDLIPAAGGGEAGPGDRIRLKAVREMDGGVEEVLEVLLPALVSIQSGVYTPRYPVLSHMLKAREKPFKRSGAAALSAVCERFLPPILPDQTREGIRAAGPVEAQARAFAAFLRERGL